MASVALVSPTPFSISYDELSRRPTARQDIQRPAPRPSLKRGAPLATSANNAPLQQPLSFSMGDSSDDELLEPPVMCSAEAESILGFETSAVENLSPPLRKEQQRGVVRLDRPPRRQSPLLLSERMRDRTASPLSSRNGSPRIVRLSTLAAAPSTLRRATSVFDSASPDAKQSQDLITPAPRQRNYRPASPIARSGSPNQERHEPRTTDVSSAGSQPQPDAITGSREHSSIHEVEVQMGNLSVNRTRGEEMGTQTGQRQKRVQFTGRFLKGPARRGIKRRQSEENPSPNTEIAPTSEEILQEHGQLSKANGYYEPRSATPAADDQSKATNNDQQRPPHVRFQSQASIITGSPEQKAHEPAKATLIDTFESKQKATASSGSSEKRVQPVFKVPPLPPLPSRHDQENEPPPTFKRNKREGIGLAEKGLFSIAQDEKMLVRTPATVSPFRPALAVRSQNTPHRPAPPPPKMSVLETATATAGAASASQSKKKRNFMSVNGKMFTRMDCIGRGGSSKVYRVMAENFKIFALKRVTLEDQDELAIRGYKGEIDLLRQLEKVDRVVRLYDFEINEEKHTLSVLMEMGEIDLNRVLHQRSIAEDAKFDITSTRYYWREMLECVSSVHALNIVHSDLKPANFLLLQGKLKLIDFGISNAIADDTVNVHREQHIGTPNYMSPEALIDSNAAAGLPSSEGKMMKLGKPSDVWSLGCILYQMVYAKPPFAHIANQMQRIMAIPNARHVISFPETGVGGVHVPAGLIRTLKRCLNRDQTQRPTVDELLSPTDPFLCPDVVARDTVPVGTELIARLQHNILKHVREKGMPTEQELALWPERFFRSIKAAVEEGRA